MRTLQNNTQFKFQIIFIVIYSAFLILDVVVAWLDFSSKYDKDKLVKVDKAFLFIFAAQNLVTVLLYVILYILFKILIRDRQGELDNMKGHVDGFFIFMISI